MRFPIRVGPVTVVCLLLGLFSPIALAQDDETCLVCHSEADLFEDFEDPSRLLVTEDQHLDSMHGAAGIGCVDCHSDLAGSDDFPHADSLPAADCGACHEDVQETFVESLHGYALQRGYPRAPTCASCHGIHDIRPSSDPIASTHESRLHELCASCHGTAGLQTDQFVKLPQTVSGYALSVHAPNGDPDAGSAATCADCHNVHGLRGFADPGSRIHRSNLSTTCGACHGEIAAEYEESIHGKALKAGVHESPTCTDCHGEHLILSPSNPDSKAHSTRMATETCGECHNDPVIIAKYSLRGDAVGSYIDSYHGWTAGRGYESAATCVSCHSAHSVLPETHEESTIHPDNLLETCRQCHEGVDQRFTASYTHESLSITANPINNWIRKIYLVLIVTVIGGMLAHNLVILSFHAVRKRRELASSPTVRRLDRAQIAQHGLMAISFIALVITGFALRFPGAWWVRYLSALGMDEPLRGNLHRIFGVLMVLVTVLHVFYVVLVRRGRREFQAMLPSRLDFREAADNLRYHTRLSDRPAEFGRYDYTQKAEYWALVWGTVLMVVTGVVLWFPGLAVKLFPAWVVTASQTVHYYEAWLAALAILVWHLFFVLFHPDEYPMNWTWLTGRMTKRAVEKHHPRWAKEGLAEDED